MGMPELAAESADLPITTALIAAVGFQPGVHASLGDAEFNPIALGEGIVEAVARLERHVAALQWEVDAIRGQRRADLA